MTGLDNKDCPSALAVCAPTSQTTGVCLAACASWLDCRAGYVCANLTNTRTAACYPIALSECDPPSDPVAQKLGCADQERCVSNSPDNSYGQCARVCDPIAQDCPAPQQGTDICVVDLARVDGSGLCIPATGMPANEGQPCAYLNDCDAGLQCYGAKCRQYCRQKGNDLPIPPCPMGQTCQDFVRGCGPGPCLTKDKLGICLP